MGRPYRVSHKEGVAQLLAFEDLDVLDYCLGIYYHPDHAAELRKILDRSGSAWTVGTDDDEGLWCLKRRVDATVLAAANEETEQRSNAAEYLRRAWHHVYSRNPNPSTAYHDAVRAVEAAARPVVTPNDDRATLGKMIPALKDKPGKWETVIGDVDTVRKMMATIWKSQSDRHGTDDTTRPLNVSTARSRSRSPDGRNASAAVPYRGDPEGTRQPLTVRDPLERNGSSVV